MPLKCAITVNPEKSARKVRVAELVRATLDGASLQTEETIVVGGTSASRFAEALGVSTQPATTSVEVRPSSYSHGMSPRDDHRATPG